MKVWKHATVLGGVLAVAGLALGAALEDGNDGSDDRAQVVVAGDHGDRHERTWVFESEEQGWLGVMLEGAPDGGARVLEVVDESPALDAGLKDGDLITAVDGEEIGSPRDLSRAIRERSPGDTVELEVMRDGDYRTITLELGESPRAFAFSFRGDDDLPFGSFSFDHEALEEHMAELHERLEDMEFNIDIPEFEFHLQGFGRPRLGIQVIQTTPELREHLGGSRHSGVLVGKVLEDSPAEEAGLQVGDLILSIDGDEVSEAGDISRRLRGNEGGGVELEIVRDGRSMTLQAFLPEPEEPRRFAPSQPLRHRIQEAPTSQRT